MAKSNGKRSGGVDDIRRGNTGTGDQGPGDVRPTGKVSARTGKVAAPKAAQGKSSGR